VESGGRIARNTASLFASEAVGRLLSYFATILLSRHFALDPYGEYALAVTLVGLAASFGDLGLNALTIREVAADRAQSARYLRAALLWRTLSSFVMFGGLALWGWWSHYEPFQRLVVLVMATRLVFDALSGGYVYLLQAHERMVFQGWVVSLGSLARFVGLGLVVAVGGSVLAAAAVWTVVSALTLLVLAWEGTRSGWRPAWIDFDLRDAARILRAALPLAVVGSLQMMYYRVDVVMIKHFLGNGPVALYYNACRLLEAALTLASMAALAALPALSARRGDPEAFGQLLEKLLRLLALGGFLTACVGAACAPAMMPLFFGSSYAQGGDVLRWLFWSAAPFFLNALVVDAWTVRNPRRLVAWYLGLLVLNVALNAWWIPRLGVSGAALATLTCECVGVLAAWPWGRRDLRPGAVRRLAPLATALVLATVWVTALASQWGGLQWILLGPLSFAGALALTRGLTWEECRRMVRALRGE